VRSRWQKFHSDESGGVAVIMTIVLTGMLMMAALVLDLGHLSTVKTEVRKAAEAGAFAGARALRLGADPKVLDWTNGKNVATSTVQQNFADSRSLADFTVTNVQAGYWDTRWTRSTTPENLLGSSDPAAYALTNPPASQVPAVKVTVAKRQGGTGSSAPVATSFAAIMGINSMGVQSSATAMLPTPNTVPPGDCFPLATPNTFVNQYYDSDPPHVFRIGDGYHNPDGGDWTSFDVDVNNVPYIRKLIDNGNPTALSINDHIWIEPGVKNTLYGYAAERTGQTVLLPVVADNFDTHAWTPIVNFVAFQITDTHQGSGPYIEGHFVRGYTINDASGAGGSYMGTSMPPKLVQ
jgi:Flp pilus assembly protein TadG